MRFYSVFGGGVGLAVISVLGLSISACSDRDVGQLASVPIPAVSTEPSRVAITIDDLPYVMPSKTGPADGLRYVESINAALRKYDITATGFAVGQQITDEAIPALQAFANAGHTIGNHSWSHPDYGTLTTEEFREETRRTDQILNQWISGPRYYRFPFLREGETEQAKSAATGVLSEFGYQNVPVTIDNDEWQFNADYLTAIERGKTNAAAEIARQYVAHMQERTAHFQDLAREQLGGDVDHILLIHMNRINADHLDTLLDWYAAQGWTFITVNKALSDPMYSRPDLYAGARGLSQIERVLGRKSD
jgi:peptidoglycan/xylan/chitin deacetylase (PgdA/CDA1 family)